MNKKTVPEQLFFCIATEVTRAEIPEFAGRAIGPLNEALEINQLSRAGDLHFICPQWKDAESKNRLIIAIPIQEDKAVAEPYFTWKAPLFKCAWTEHKGPVPSLKNAWNSFVEKTQEESLQPTGSWREVYKHWESFESENNLTELQMEIQ